MHQRLRRWVVRQTKCMTQLVSDGGKENAVWRPRMPWRRLHGDEDISACQATRCVAVKHRHAWIARRKSVAPIKSDICFQRPAHHRNPQQPGARPCADGFFDKLLMPLRPAGERRGWIDPQTERARSRPTIGTSSGGDSNLHRLLGHLVVRDEDDRALLYWQGDDGLRWLCTSYCGTTTYDRNAD